MLMRTCTSRFGVEARHWLQSPDLNLPEDHWDELKRRQRGEPSCPTSLLYLINVHDWSKVLEHVVEVR